MNVEPLEAPSPYALKNLYPLSFESSEAIKNFRTVLHSASPLHSKLMIIVGPCSIHHHDAFITYATKLASLQTYVESHIQLVIRAYIEKPRTSFAWKGFVHQPSAVGAPSYIEGLHAARRLLVACAELKLPIATELLDPWLYYYFDDLISWGCIGARTSASQPHRQLASLCSFPVGFKNFTDGSLDAAIHGMLYSKQPQCVPGVSQEGKLAFFSSKGNLSPYLVLRGGSNCSNYDTSSILHAYASLDKKGLDPKIIIDCSHDNSKKNLEKQQEIFKELILKKTTEDLPILGVMLESFLQRGSQPISKNIAPDISITDPCLSFEETADLVEFAYKQLTHSPALFS